MKTIYSSKAEFIMQMSLYQKDKKNAMFTLNTHIWAAQHCAPKGVAREQNKTKHRED